MRIIIYSTNRPVVGSPQQVSGWGQHGHSLVIEGEVGEIELVTGTAWLSLRADSGKLDITSYTGQLSMLLDNNVTLRTGSNTIGYGYEPDEKTSRHRWEDEVHRAAAILRSCSNKLTRNNAADETGLELRKLANLADAMTG